MSSKHTCSKSCHVLFMVNFRSFPGCRVEWVLHNVPDFFPGIINFILWILKLIDGWNDKSSYVVVALSEIYSFSWIFIHDIIPLYRDIYTCFGKVCHNDGRWMNDRPKIMDGTSFVYTLCHNMNNTEVFILAEWLLTSFFDNCDLEKRQEARVQWDIPVIWCYSGLKWKQLSLNLKS